MDDETKAALESLREDARDLKVGQLELRASLAENRNTVTEARAELTLLRLAIAERGEETNRLLNLLIDELAAFRAEYQGHTHPEGE